MISIRQLRYFVEIVEARGYTRASERLFIAQSALSRQVKELEADLDVVLLKRDAKAFELTQAGQDFYERSRRILLDLTAPWPRPAPSARASMAPAPAAFQFGATDRAAGPTLNDVLKDFPAFRWRFPRPHPNTRPARSSKAAPISDWRGCPSCAPIPIWRAPCSTASAWWRPYRPRTGWRRSEVEIAELRDEFFVTVPHRDRG
jgi:hypothetical protein